MKVHEMWRCQRYAGAAPAHCADAAEAQSRVAPQRTCVCMSKDLPSDSGGKGGRHQARLIVPVCFLDIEQQPLERPAGTQEYDACRGRTDAVR